MKQNCFQPSLQWASLAAALLFGLFPLRSTSQQVNIRDFAVFGTGLQLGTSTTIVSGKIGSYSTVSTSGTSVINGDIHTLGRVQLANSNTVNGNIYAANNAPGITGTTVQTGSNAAINGNIYSGGHISIGGGSVNGAVRYLPGFSYSGPTPSGGHMEEAGLIFPVPQLPNTIAFPNSGTQDITTNTTITPGAYRDIKLTGARTVIFSGPGVYIFNSIRNSGNFNKFIFDFQNQPGIFRIYVHGDVDVFKINIETPGGGGAQRIFMEVHGNGQSAGGNGFAWSITNGASGNNQSTWQGTVWAPNGPINVGSGSSQSKIIGALWSNGPVVIQNGVSITHAMLDDCADANAGPDRLIDCDNPNTTLNGSSNHPNAIYSWSMIDGTIPSTVNTADPSITVSASGLYVLAVTTPECPFPETDTTEVLSDPCVLPYYPPPVSGKVDLKIGSELYSLYNNFGSVMEDGAAMFLIDSANGMVLINIVVLDGNYNSVLSIVTAPDHGLTGLLPNGQSQLIITGFYPIANLDKFELDPLKSLINFVEPVTPPLTNSGVVISGGDKSMRSDLVRAGFNIAGEGVKIGVLSDSYNTLPGNPAALGVANGELPGPGNGINSTPVQVLQDYPFGAKSDEGRAMLEIIHDVAPKAALGFRTGFISPGDFAEGIRELAAADYRVIVDDITYITQPFFRPGVISQAITEVHNQYGVHYVTAAGNFGSKSYEGFFQPAVSVPLPFGIQGVAHDFGGGNILQQANVSGTLLKPGLYTMVLQWDESFYSLGETQGTASDLDIYIIDNLGNLVGFNRVNILGDPSEIITFRVTATTSVNIMIVNSTEYPAGVLPPAVRFKYVVFRGEFSLVNPQPDASTIVGHGNTPEAITVGAVLYSRTPAYDSSMTVASFSSVGGSYYQGAVSMKPDLVGPNGVNTTVNFGSVDYEGDNIPNFFGTSAAAPHIAAGIALVLEAKQKYENIVLTPAQVKALITGTSVPVNSGQGFDFYAGSGLIHVDSAIRSFANPRPFIGNLALEDSSLIPGVQEMDIIITGSYLSSQTIILLDGVPLSTTIISQNEARATLPVFSGEKTITAFTPPISALGIDGGESNERTINGYNKKSIVIRADDKTKKYGQVLPAFSSGITVDGVPLASSGLTLQDLGLEQIHYTTNATVWSPVGIYHIAPSREFDENNPDDAGLLQLYDYSFQNGALIIQKLSITIQPQDMTIHYGEQPGPIAFNYTINDGNIADHAALLDSIAQAHQAFVAANALAVINGFALPQSNGLPLSQADLQGLSMMTSFQALVNGRRFDVENNRLVSVADPAAFNAYYLVDVNATTIYDFLSSPATASFVSAWPGVNNRAMVNGASLSNGSAIVNGSLQQLVNGSLVQMVNGDMGAMAPVINGSLVQMVNGSLVQMVNGEPVPIPNGSLVQMVNGSLVQLVNGVFEPLPNGSLVQMVNGSLVQMVNGSLQQLVNGSLQQLVNGSLVQMVNGSLQQLVNGVYEPIPNGSLVQMVNGSLVQMVNGSLQQLVNGNTVGIVNGSLQQLVNGIWQPIPNGSLVQMVNGSLVQMVNGSLQQLVNGIWEGIPNGSLVQMVNSVFHGNVAMANVGVIIDEADVNVQQGWLGAMFGINMVSGLDVGTNVLVSGVFANNNFEPDYLTGNLQVLAAEITVKAIDQEKNYGDALIPGNTGFEVTGLADGESIASVTLTSAGAAASASAGIYDIIPSDAVAAPGTDLSNYSIVYENGVLAVNKVPLVITAHDTSRIYGAANPVFAGTVTGIRNNDNIGGSYSTNAVAGSPVGTYSILSAVSDPAGKAGNYEITLHDGVLTITKATLTVTANNATKLYGEQNPAFSASYSGFANSETLATSDVSGQPALSTTATTHSSPGVYPVTAAPGTLQSGNYQFSFVNGTLTISPNSCFVNHSPFSSFSSSANKGTATTLWVTVTIKLGGQLSQHGDYFLLTGGTITLNNVISQPVVNNTPLANGKVMADMNIAEPVTYYSITENMWITLVPPGYNTSSDIFISGTSVVSSNGFDAKKQTGSVIGAVLYSNKSGASSQWNYAMAAYQPVFNIASVSAPGSVVAVNGTYKAGTPLPHLSHVVSGGTGNGGNNYTGSNGSWDNFTACQDPSAGFITRMLISAEPEVPAMTIQELKLFPNPAGSHVNISFTPGAAGPATLTLISMDGRQVKQLYQGVSGAGNPYFLRVETGALASGVYLVQLRSASGTVTRKLVITNP